MAPPCRGHRGRQFSSHDWIHNYTNDLWLRFWLAKRLPAGHAWYLAWRDGRFRVGLSYCREYQ